MVRTPPQTAASAGATDDTIASLSRHRFAPERAWLAELMRTPELDNERDGEQPLGNPNGTSLRTRLLGRAVRIEPRIVPALAEAFGALAERVPEVGRPECYVYNDPSINAFVAEGRRHTLIAVSSGAINQLEAAELRFVLGHELAHIAFGHTRLATERLAAAPRTPNHLRMRLMAWQRAAEISADRVGLFCCGDITQAASALFKTVSGLTGLGIHVHPEAFAEQWSHLLEEAADDGARDHWVLTHPFPPLRMRALLGYWSALTTGADRQALDAEVTHMLAMMDPRVAGDDSLSDPLLAGFFFWGGLYACLGRGRLNPRQQARLATLVPRDVQWPAALEHALATPDVGHERFAACMHQRRRKLTAQERHRILTGVLEIASDGDGAPDVSVLGRVRALGEVIGISAMGCDLIAQEVNGEH